MIRYTGDSCSSQKSFSNMPCIHKQWLSHNTNRWTALRNFLTIHRAELTVTQSNTTCGSKKRGVRVVAWRAVRVLLTQCTSHILDTLYRAGSWQRHSSFATLKEPLVHGLIALCHRSLTDLANVQCHLNIKWYAEKKHDNSHRNRNIPSIPTSLHKSTADGQECIIIIA